MKLSIRKFLLINLLLALVATTSLTLLGNYYFDQEDIDKNLDNSLSQTAFMLNTFVQTASTTDTIPEIQKKLVNLPARIKTEVESYEGPTADKYQFQYWNAENILILHSAHAPEISFADAHNGFADKIINGEKWRVFTIHNEKHKSTFALAEHHLIRDELGHRITDDDIYTLLLNFPLAGLLIWFIVGRGLYTIKRVANEVSQRAPDHLEPFETDQIPEEIEPLVNELNLLFLHLKQAFEREQRFAADAAHELRTPLAALKTQAQVALKTTDSKDRQVHLQNVISGVDRCTHVIQQLLILCRMTPESITLEEQAVVDLADAATEVISELAAGPEALNKQIELISKEPPYLVLGNATGLYALIRNLVDNAIRYTPKDTMIKVSLMQDEKHVILRVVDNGPGIPAEFRSRVFERFFRVLGTSATGSGLGLAIAGEIVKLHRGTIKIGSPAEGTGLEVEIHLPRYRS